MPAGASAGLTAAQVQGQAGALAKEIQNLLTRVTEFNTFLAATNLQTAYSISSADEADIKSAYSSMVALIAIYAGGSTVGTANQAKTFLDRLTGFGAHL